LGTPPEKDLGFPYSRYANYWKNEEEFDESSYPPARDGRPISQWMLAEFSYQHFLMESHGEYGSFIDAGKPHPIHARWAAYLQWVQTRIFSSGEAGRSAGAELRFGRATAITLTADGRWSIELDTPAQPPVVGEGLVITGPGQPLTSLGRSLPPDHPRFLNGQ